jgi:arginyl-tRNA synthetase
MQTKHHIQTLIKNALESLDLEFQESGLDHPTDLLHGDYASSVAMVLGKKLGQNPKELAFSIAEKISLDRVVERVEVAGPGFINFYLTGEFFKKTVSEIDEHFGKSTVYKGKTILVEHSSPNLFKPFHIGHVMNNAVGESVARLAEFSGAKLIKVSYPSDVSLGIGKAVWALLEHSTTELENLETTSEKLAFLGNCYVEGTKAYEENPSLERRIREITEMIYPLLKP